MSRWARMLTVTCVAALTATSVGPAQARVELGPTELVSADGGDVPGDGLSFEHRLSANGRFVAFGSLATNLVPDDTNAVSDVFVKDLTDGSIERISVDERGNQLASHSYPSSMSADGRYVLFTSRFEQVEEPGGVTADRTVTRLADRASGTSRRIETRARNGELVRLDGAQLTGNGRYVVFTTRRRLVPGDRDRYGDVYRLEPATGAMRRMTVPPIDASGSPGTGSAFSVSHSGRLIAFLTGGRLVRKDRRVDGLDVYVRDVRQRRPRLVSQSTTGVQAKAGSRSPTLSANGRWVLFTTRARNLVRHDTNHKDDLFLRDLRAGTTERVSLNSREREGDQNTGTGSISGDGRFLVFQSRATNFAPGTTDFGGGPRGNEANVFLRDLKAGTTTAITMAPDGSGADSTSSGGVISRDGSTVVFYSTASNLVEGVDAGNIYLRRLERTTASSTSGSSELSAR